MKNNIQKVAKKELEAITEKKITRKEAIRKSGYIALSAATMMLLLSNPEKAQAASPAPPTVWP